MNHIDDIVGKLESIREDYNKAMNGNRAAATRVRKMMQEVKASCQDLRYVMLSPPTKTDSDEMPPF